MPGRDSQQDQGNVERRRFLKGTGAGALAVGLAGCAGDGTSTPTSEETETETETPTATPESVDTDEPIPEGGTLTLGLPSPPPSMNYLSENSAYATTVFGHVVESGTTFDVVNYDIHDWVFSDWEIRNVDSGEPDVMINVRTEVDGTALTWTDGTEFTKDQVKWSYDYLLEQQPGLYRGILSSIDEFVAADGDWDFRMSMNEVDGLYESRQLALPIVPEHIWSDVDTYTEYAPGENGGPVGLGWGEVTTYNPDTAIEVTFRDDFPLTNLEWVQEFDNYLAGGPFLDSLRFQVFTSQPSMEQSLLNGDLDGLYGNISSTNLSAVQDSDRLEIIQGQDNGFGYIGHNLRRVPHDDAAFRQAIAMVWDDVYWTDRLNSGQELKGDFPISPGYSHVRPESFSEGAEVLTDPATNAFDFRQSSPGVADIEAIRGFLADGQVISGESGEYAGQEYPGSLSGVTGDQTEAKHDYSFGEVQSEVLQEAGVDQEIRVNGQTITEMKGRPLTYLMYPPELVPELTKMDEVYVEALKNLGIPIEREVQTFNSLLTRIYGEEDFDMYHMGWSTGPFGASTLYGIFHSDNADDHSVVEEGTEQENHPAPTFNNAYGYGGADDLITGALEELETERRRELTAQAVEKIYLDHPIDVFGYSQVLWPLDTSNYDGYLEGIVGPGSFYLVDQFFNLHQTS